MLWLFVGPTRVYLLDFFCSVIQFYLLLSLFLGFISFLYLDLYVLGDDALISWGSFMQTKHLCVLIHIWTKVEVGAPLNRFKPSSKIFYWPFQGGTSFVDLLCVFFLSCGCYAFARVCLYVPGGHPLGKDWPPGSRLWCLTVGLLLSHWYPGSGVVLDCIGSWSLHPYLLSTVKERLEHWIPSPEMQSSSHNEINDWLWLIQHADTHTKRSNSA